MVHKIKKSHVYGIVESAGDYVTDAFILHG